MAKKESPFIRLICESCGAPLIKSDQRGKFICEYCGSVYYGSDYENEFWEEKAEPFFEPSVEEFSPVSRASIKRKKLSIWVWLICGAVLMSCFYISVFGGIFSDVAGFSTDSGIESIIKPIMLAKLPSAVNAGTEVAYAGWEINVNPEFKLEDNRIYFTYTIKSWDEGNQVLTYQPNSIVVYDDLQNTYPLNLGNCEEDLPYLKRQVTFEQYDEFTFSSSSFWCNDQTEIPSYFGTIPIDANHLYLHMKDFGVYSNITFVFDL